ncbi:MAG: DUF748 domain-containing protein, partial [Gemmatimonadota bacterium]
PYWGGLVRARIRRGRLSVAGRYVIDLRPGLRTLRLDDGALSIADLEVAEGDAADAPVAFAVGRFDLRGVTADAETRRARVALVATDDGRLSARRGRDGVWNLARPSSGPLPEVRIGRLRVTDTRFAFDDSTKAPVFSSAIGPLALSLDEFSSRPDARNRYGLSGTIGRDESFSWSGTLQVSPFRSEGAVRLADFAMPTYEPYWGGLVRARIRRGRLSVAGRYVIDLRPGLRTLRLDDGALSIADLEV